MINELYVEAMIDAIEKQAERNGDTYILQGIEIIKKMNDLRDDLGNKLHKVPHKNYPEILRHLEAIEELFDKKE